MSQPRRSIKNIRPLPSIYTKFSPTYESSNNTSEHSGKCLIRQIEEGIEVVPFERSNILSAPILSPDTTEKEVLMISQRELRPVDKPLPFLPRTLWGRLSAKQRIIAIVFVQVALLLTIGLALLAAKGRTPRGRVESAQVTDLGTAQAQDAIPIARGTFSIPISAAQQQGSACLSRTNESVAWQCASDTSFQLAILPSYGKSNKTLITLGALATPNRTIYHGHQAPEVRMIELTRLSNSESASYHFRTTYDRIVYLRDGDLTSAGNPRAQPIVRHLTIVPGESLWRCTFNETVIEGYIYPNKTTFTDTSPANATAGMVMNLPKMPHVMKIVEQRMPNGRAPYCEKVKMGYEGKMENNGGSERVVLRVSEPVAEVNAKASRKELTKTLERRLRLINGHGYGNGNGVEKRQSDAQSYCKCQWLVQ